MKLLALAAATLVVLTASATAERGARRAAGPVTTIRDISLELIGQVTNSPAGRTPATSVQVGYLAYLRGLPIFKGEPENETTALFTFYMQATTLRVISDGPLRIVTRVGKMTFYRDPAANGDFGDPESFRDGAPVLAVALRQQVVVDTLAATFTAHNLNTITSTTPFPARSRKLQLGHTGEKFETFLSGHQNMPAPPSGYFAGYTVSR